MHKHKKLQAIGLQVTARIPTAKSKWLGSAASLVVPAIALAVPMIGVMVDGAGSPAQALPSCSSTVSGTYSSGLSLVASCNPFTNNGTITNAGGHGITGGNSAAWTVLNNGTASSSSSYGDGIHLGSLNNTITNASTGRINGSSNGMGIYSFGIATVSNAGTITGGIFGVLVNNDGSINNSAGLISGGNGASLGGNGTISNAVGGRISGSYKGVEIYGGGSVANDGRITGGTYGVFFYDGGSLTNTGTIISPAFGV